MELSPIIKEALILLGKIQYNREYEPGSVHRFGELMRQYEKNIKPELEKLENSSEITEILLMFKVYEPEKKEMIEAEKRFNLSAGLIR